tara:strand:- start:67 stop:1095 length:1029 start_codon:yes stop_codon:yes gene_type:complete
MKLTRLIAGAALCVAAFGAAQPASAEDPSGTWRWAHFSAEAWGSSQADKLFAEELKKLTDGKLDTRFYWAGAMGSGTELLELTANNAVDVGSFVPSYFPGQMPLMSLVNSIPLTFTDPVVAMEVQQKLAMDNPYFQEELKKNKVYPIVFHGLAPYRLQCTTPVRKIEDIKGLRVRTFGEWPPKMFEQLGAVPVNIGMVEVYEALQRGSLDCAYLSVEGAGFLKIGEVAKYWSDINLGAIAAYSSFVSYDTYQSWSDEFKAKVAEAASVAEAFEKESFARLEKSTMEEAAGLGVEFVKFEDMDKVNEVVPNMLDAWVKSMCGMDMCEAAESTVAEIRSMIGND